MGTFATSAFCGDSIKVGIGSDMIDVIGYSSGSLSGPLAPIYECVFDDADLEVNYTEMPLKRGFKYLDEGKIEALLPLAKSPIRDRRGLFAGELFVADYVFVALDSIAVLEETVDLRYVAPRGFIGSELIQDHDAQIYEVTEWSQAVSMLRYDRADVAVLPELLVGKLFDHDTVDLYQRFAGTLPISLYLADKTQKTSVASAVIAAVKNCSVDNFIQPNLLR